MKSTNTILLKAIEKIIENKISNIYYDKTFPSIVYEINPDKTYKIVREGVLYDVPCAINVELKVTQKVWVTMPSGITNLKNMYISGIRM